MTPGEDFVAALMARQSDTIGPMVPNPPLDALSITPDPFDVAEETAAEWPATQATVAAPEPAGVLSVDSPAPTGVTADAAKPLTAQADAAPPPGARPQAERTVIRETIEVQKLSPGPPGEPDPGTATSEPVLPAMESPATTERLVNTIHQTSEIHLERTLDSENIPSSPWPDVAPTAEAVAVGITEQLQSRAAPELAVPVATPPPLPLPPLPPMAAAESRPASVSIGEVSVEILAPEGGPAPAPQGPAPTARVTTVRAAPRSRPFGLGQL